MARLTAKKFNSFNKISLNLLPNCAKIGVNARISQKVKTFFFFFRKVSSFPSYLALALCMYSTLKCAPELDPEERLSLNNHRRVQAVRTLEELL